MFRYRLSSYIANAIIRTKVSIEAVKAFYTDVYSKNAEQGIIATSSYIAPGGKKIVDALKYIINFAEKKEVEQWTRDLWQFS